MGQQYSHLSSEERILIEKLHCEQHLSVRKIAEEIGRDKSTVSRELRRGLWFASNENGSYRPYRPKRLKTGPWTSGPFYSALAAQRKADCFASMFVRQVRQCFSAVWADGFPRCRHRFPVM